MRGGMTSHAAVVARGMGTCCISGCGDMDVHEDEKYFTLGGHTIHEGDYISLDGSTGKIYLGDVPTVEASISGNFQRIMDWADKYRRLHVRTNADTPSDAANAVRLGAEGIGLTRTEHMFFNPDRIPKIRKMILSDTTEEREAALNELIPFQKGDFKGLYKAMEGRPVTIRFLDPPLHEFVPNTEPEIEGMAKEMGLSVAEVKKRCDDLKEFNPMMGHRGCRLSVTFPEIARMQTRAVMEAAIEVNEEEGYHIEPEIMVPLVGDVKELRFVKNTICETAEKVKKEKNSDIKYHIGTMIEIPRAALLADEIAEEAEFFSFGTNDLTQMTFGFSRDDAGKFLADYYKSKIYEQDPFAHLDQNGVGQLIQIAVEKGRKTRPDIHLGICGEHGGGGTGTDQARERKGKGLIRFPNNQTSAAAAAAAGRTQKKRWHPREGMPFLSAPALQEEAKQRGTGAGHCPSPSQTQISRKPAIIVSARFSVSLSDLASLPALGRPGSAGFT